SIQSQALQAGFSGYVRNLNDGTVEAGVTCSAERLDEFKALLRRGSEVSRVDTIAQYDSNEAHSGRFEVR
ncbi:MAG: acylphosphatase, partial [Sulfurimonadaceae bacterium]|nr:acylphosphatase [Sulfurimonadaceae bacterium]